jgi:hypothetical protein
VSEESSGYVFLLLVFFGASIFAYKLIETRIKKDALLRKYKRGTAENLMLQRLLRPGWLVLCISIALISLVSLIRDVRMHNNLHAFLPILIITTVVIVVGIIWVPRILGVPLNERVDK